MKRIFIVHGWGGSPKSGWMPWLEQELRSKNYQVIVPEMPHTEAPKIEEWVPALANAVGNVDGNTYFVGHSIGCQTILRYLQTVDKKIGGIVFVAPWLGLKGLETEEEKEIAKPWVNTPINFKNIRPIVPKVTAIFSDDDPFVFLTDAGAFKDKLGAKTVIEKSQGHFDDSEYEIILSEVLKIC